MSKNSNLCMVDEFFLSLSQNSNGNVSYKSELSNTTEGPFLSVVTRTQGKRIETLTETLLCLTGQSNTDFEVLVVGHNINEQQEKSVLEIIEKLPDWMQEKTRLVKIDGGSRSAPLNKGFSEAKGKYISILDDDDLVFDNWVETFYQLSLENEGKILHAYAVSQKWKSNSCENGQNLMAVSSFDRLYCQDFELIKQLSANSCPTMSLAFPSYAFNKLGIRFNETLDTTEDWDFLMRSSFVTGVANADEITSIYRLWTNSESSATLFDQKAWDDNYTRVQNGLFDKYMLIKVGDLKKYVAAKNSSGASFGSMNEAEILVDSGSGFDVTNPATMKFDSTNISWNIEVTNLDSYDNIKKIRFRPSYVGVFMLHDLTVEAVDKDGNSVPVKFNNSASNCQGRKSEKFFSGFNSWSVWNIDAPNGLKSLKINFTRQDNIPIYKLCLLAFKFFIAKLNRKAFKLIKR